MIRYIHGSEDSLDLDVIYVFESIPTFKEAQSFCSLDEIENRNIVVIEDGKVIWCFKGTVEEINNGIFFTYPLHKQEHQLIITKLVERDTLIKTVRVVRCVLSHLSRTSYRENVKKALKSSSWSLKLNTIKDIDLSKINDFGNKGNRTDILKIFAFQIGQISSLLDGKELYTKSSIANEYPDLKKYLYREENTTLNDMNVYLDKLIKKIETFEVSEENGITHFKDFNKKINLKTEEYL